MKIFFYGASKTVTGSSFLVETSDLRLLIDCGMFQGSKIIKELNYGDFPYDPKTIDSVILTHAHIDHSGLLPKLITNGYSGPIYATPETIEFCSIMLPDSGYIQEMEIERKNRKRTRADLPLLKPIYTAKDGLNALKSFIPLKYCQSIELSKTVSVQLFDAGHILGSAFVVLTITEGESTQKIVFSGDIGTTNQPYIEDPTLIEEADLIIMETTYGNRIHENKVNRLEILADVINAAHAKGGNIIIPAFAIERTQDILYYLQQLQIEQKIPKLPVYIDSPLAIAATKVFQKNTTNFDEESTALIENGNNPLTMENLNFSETTEESIRLNSITQGAIIISASGMADAGRIKHHLKHNLWRSNATIVFVGYQAEGTLGRRLIDGTKEVTIHGENISVNASITQLPSFSAHADQTELLEWVMKTGKHAKGIILVHGEENSAQGFSILLEQHLAKKPIVPDLGECISYFDNEIIQIKPEKPWIQALEEKLLSATKIKDRDNNLKSSETKYTSRKFSRPKKVLQSEVNHSYYKLKKNLKLFVDNAKKERDYSFIIETLNQISQILTESKNKHRL
jgi:metallo-beta-lactamase family protein